MIKYASEHEYLPAVYYYSILLQEGKYVEKNEEESIKYLKRSAYEGNI